MKKIFLLLTLLGMTATAGQAQLLKSTVATPTESAAESAQVEGVDFRTINGQLPPMVVGKRHANRVAAYKPSGYIYGTRIYSNVWSDYSRVGMYALSPDEPVSSSIYEGDLFNTTRGVVYFDGKLWISHVEKGFSVGDDNTIVTNNRVTHYVFNVYTGQIENYINPGYPSATGPGLAYDRYTGTIIGCFSNNTLNGNIFGTLDPNTGIRMPIAELEVMLTAVVIDNDHRMWGVERKSGDLYEIDMTNGTLRKAGNIGVTSAYMNCGVIDPVTGVFYYHTCNLYESSLYAIDTETCTATLVYAIPTNDEWSSMWMLPQLSDGVPQAPANVRIDSDGMDCAVSFIVPRPLANGSMGQGQATYTVYVDGAAAFTGEANYGSNVGVPLTMEHGGEYIIAIALKNDQGESEIVRQMVTIGDAAVPAPATVTLALSGNNFNVTWDAVDMAGVTYNVTRYPGEVQVATGLTATSFTEAVPGGVHTNYFYTVTAHVGNAQSASTRSNYVATGSFGLPYSNHFETKDRANELTYINANNDNKVWTYAVNCDLRGSHGIYLPKPDRVSSGWSSSQPPSDDWAITPGLPLEAGKSYAITYKLFGTYADMEDYRERFEVKMGTSPTVAGMTTTIQSAYTLSNDNVHPLTITFVFAAPGTGTYYIGLHGISNPGFWFGCLGIDVAEGVPSSAPNQPKSLSITPAADGALTAEVSVGLSSWNTLKQNIGTLSRAELRANGQLIHTWENPTPGANVTTTVTVPRDGSYEFVAVAYDANGVAGIPRAETAYVGVRPPSVPTNALLVETNVPGVVNMSWDAVTTNIDGTTIDPSKVTYTVYDATEYAIVRDQKETSLNIQAMDYDNSMQQFVRFYVTSHFNTFYSSQAAYTPYLLVGKPYELPFHETTTIDAMRYAWLMSGDLGWDVTAEDSDLHATDGDGTCYFIAGSEANQTGTMTSGRIHISGTAPKLSLDYATLQNCTNTLAVKVICDGVTTTLGTLTLTGDASSFTWKSVEYDLSAYADKNIQIEITGTVVSHAAVIIDNIQVTSTPDTEPGDVNGDGAVDVEDVNALINVILDLTTPDALAGIADVNGDGAIDIEDVNALINMILAQ
ncbi:MAG: dockerin type I repeat-containing protein [Muribaculaceae bacterium]|nr:dockerin type I repeat-containing protein [Muribaculaceae bacterium]